MSGETTRTVLRDALRVRPRTMAAAVVLRMGHQVGEALVPVMIGVVVDEALGTGSVGALLGGLAGLGVVFLGLSLSFRFGARAGTAVAEQAGHELRMRIATRILAPEGGVDRLPGVLFALATADAARVGGVVRIVATTAASAAALAVVVVSLVRISVPLALLVVLGTPLMLFLGNRMARPLERRSRVEQERSGTATGLAADLVEGMRVLRGIRGEEAAARRYRDASQASLRATLRAARVEAALGGSTVLVTGVFLVVVTYVGGLLALDHTISVGELIAAVGLTQFLAGPMNQFAALGAGLAQARGSATRAAELLSAPTAMHGGGAAPVRPVAGEIRLDRVELTGVTGLDLLVEPGEHVGIVTADAELARAIADLLGRQREPDAGRVSLDGRPVSGLDLGSARAALHLLAHNSRLFSGTLRENLDASGTTPTAALADALTAAQAEDVLAALPDGLDTEIGERGGQLSGGQRQRVALARALAANPPVLIAHDPTTAVDPVTETGIGEGIRALRRGRTTVLVTTSPILLERCDRVVHLRPDGGAAVGIHHELVATDHDYRELTTR